jgi:hypothetical protein
MGKEPDATVTGRKRQEKRLRVTHHSSKSTHDTIKLPVESITCVRLDGYAFPFGTSFLMPQAAKSLKKALERYRKFLVEEHPEYCVTIFGHTDSEGASDYNKNLSQRRAQTIMLFVLNKANKWESLYHQEKWGSRIVKIVLQALGEPIDADTVRSYTDGHASSSRRKALFLKYMTHPEYSIEVDYFFTGNNKERATSPWFIGCGEYNPIKDHSPTDYPNETERRQLNSINRRVNLFWWHGKGPEKFPNCGSLDCLGSKADSPLPGKQEFRCAFYWRHFSTSKCEGPKVKARSICIGLKILYDYLIKKAQKSVYECTLLRILHKCFQLDDAHYKAAKCEKEGVNWWILHPHVYNRFFESRSESHPGNFPYQRGVVPNRPEYELFSYRPRNRFHMDGVIGELNNGRVPQELKRRFREKSFPISDIGVTVEKRGTDCWWVTDKHNGLGKQMFDIHVHAPYDFVCYRLSYIQMIGATVPSGHIDAYGKITPVRFDDDNSFGAYDRAEISVRDFFENPVDPTTKKPSKSHYAKRYNYIAQELLRVVFHDAEVVKGSRFDPQTAVRKLTHMPHMRLSTWNRLWESSHSIVCYLENHISEINRTFRGMADLDGGQSGAKLEAQFLVYYKEKLRDHNSIYSCCRHGSRTVRNAFWRGETEVSADNACKDTGRKCNPAECLGMR